MSFQSLQAPMVIVGMLNGMIGGVILVLPLLVLDSGSLGSGLIIILTGLFSYYSCMLCLKHLGRYRDLDQSIMRHFNKSMYIKIFYDFIVFLNLFLLLILYFELIVQQWEGLSNSTIINPIVNFCVLLFLVLLMKYYEFGVSLLAYGIISCVGYCMFLIWMLATAPTGQATMGAFGSGVVTLAASMGQAFSIQTIFVPILRRNKEQPNYQSYTMITFIAGFCIYMYIGYMGAFGILNRQPAIPNPQTIQQYFPKGYWQLYILQIIYLIHLYSVFPEFLLISNKRFLSMFGKSMSQKGTISIYEVIYVIVVMLVCIVVGLVDVDIGDIIQINGAVVGFFFIYFLPALTHIKCVYGPTISEWLFPTKTPKQKQIQIAHMPSLGTIKQQTNQQQSSIRTSLLTTTSRQDNPPPSDPNNNSIQEVPCQCSTQQQSVLYTVFDVVMLTGMMATGAFIMYEGFANVVS